MINALIPRRTSFENFKSTVCHRVKEMGDIDFMMDALENEDVRVYFEWKWYPECFYVLGMLDYLSGLNDIPLCSDYDDLRMMKLEKPVFPLSVLAKSAVEENDDAKEKALENAIPEFLRFNIVENEVRNVV